MKSQFHNCSISFLFWPWGSPEPSLRPLWAVRQELTLWFTYLCSNSTAGFIFPSPWTPYLFLSCGGAYIFANTLNLFGEGVEISVSHALYLTHPSKIPQRVAGPPSFLSSWTVILIRFPLGTLLFSNSWWHSHHKGKSGLISSWLYKDVSGHTIVAWLNITVSKYSKLPFSVPLNLIDIFSKRKSFLKCAFLIAILDWNSLCPGINCPSF